MQTATLGGLIKDYRLKKRLSQVEVSIRMGWNDTTRLSKIEQGRVGKPTRETIDKIIKALDLTQEEKGEFLLVGGYLPEQSEIEEIYATLQEYIKHSDYPLIIIDFSWRLLFVNESWLDLFQVPKKIRPIFKNSKPNLLELVFSTGGSLPVLIEKGDSDKTMIPFEVAQIAKFRAEQMGREGDSWFVSLIKRLTQNDKFRELWPSADAGKYNKELMDYEFLMIKDKSDPKQLKRFHVLRSRVRSDRRFQVVLYIPDISH